MYSYMHTYIYVFVCMLLYFYSFVYSCTFIYMFIDMCNIYARTCRPPRIPNVQGAQSGLFGQRNVRKRGSDIVWCCSCCVFVCVTCFSSYRNGLCGRCYCCVFVCVTRFSYYVNKPNQLSTNQGLTPIRLVYVIGLTP